MERPALLFLSVLSLFSLACGFLESDGDISFTPDIPAEFSVDANSLCPPGEDCSGEQNAAPADIELAAIDLDVDIDVVEQTGNDELADYAGAFKSIEIVGVRYETKDNSLTFDLPESDLYIGPVNAETTSDSGVAKLATIPSIPAGTDTSGSAPVAPAGRAASADLLRDLKLSAILSATPVVREGQPFPPSGRADMKLVIKVRFTANPLGN